jgi:ABC-type multidrug transport system permease subunit
MIEGSALLSLLVQLVIAGLIVWLIWWFVDYVGIPEPFNKVVRVILGLVILIYLINVLLSIGGRPLFRW